VARGGRLSTKPHDATQSKCVFELVWVDCDGIITGLATQSGLYLDFPPRYNPFAAPQRLKLAGYPEMYLFILDSLGSTELLVILGAALIFFGPRRLPQLSHQLGKALAEFRRASEDFKRTWEREVNIESFDKGLETDATSSIIDKATEKIRAAREAAALDSAGVSATAETIAPSITPVDPALVQPRESNIPAEPVPLENTHGKHEWL
jgi:sec-independent protein translocase protein TatA